MGKVIPIKKKPSGENIPEAMRKTVAVKLRLRPEVADMLRDAAGNQEMGLSEFISRLLTKMEKHPDVPCGVFLEDLRGPYR